MIKLRWLTRSWEELHETGFKHKSERVLQYKTLVPTPTVDVCDPSWSEWKDVEEEFSNLK